MSIPVAAALALLWAALLGQGDAPVLVASARFKAGWTGLASVLGNARVDALMEALTAEREVDADPTRSNRSL